MWAWMQEAPMMNLDDYGPQNASAFGLEMDNRVRHEWVWGVTMDGQPVGAIGVAPGTSRTAMFHGIVFTAAVHGLGVAQKAVRDVLAWLWANGIEKVSAAYFADNLRVGAFLWRLGAVQEGLLRRQTVRGGEAIDMALVAFFRE
jgi:RimJ/RimL family protein N-acetyltransferase